MLLLLSFEALGLDKSVGKVAPIDDLRSRTGGAKIRCPQCAWVPRAEDRWMCACFYTWNTFDTRGRCPACSHQWTETQCLACHEWSLHEDWYVKDRRAR